MFVQRLLFNFPKVRFESAASKHFCPEASCGVLEAFSERSAGREFCRECMFIASKAISERSASRYCFRETYSVLISSTSFRACHGRLLSCPLRKVHPETQLPFVLKVMQKLVLSDDISSTASGSEDFGICCIHVYIYIHTY